MKSWCRLAALSALLVPQLIAQDKAPSDLDTLLRDSAYVLNRFEEASVGLASEIDLSNTPTELKRSRKEALSSVLRNVELEKPFLNALLSHPHVSSVDLLDVYTGVDEVASELEGESPNVANWGDPKAATDLAQLGAKARMLSADIFAKLRSQVAAQELQLVSCSHKASSTKPKQ